MGTTREKHTSLQQRHLEHRINTVLALAPGQTLPNSTALELQTCPQVPNLPKRDGLSIYQCQKLPSLQTSALNTELDTEFSWPQACQTCHCTPQGKTMQSSIWCGGDRHLQAVAQVTNPSKELTLALQGQLDVPQCSPVLLQDHSSIRQDIISSGWFQDELEFHFILPRPRNYSWLTGMLPLLEGAHCKRNRTWSGNLPSNICQRLDTTLSARAGWELSDHSPAQAELS